MRQIAFVTFGFFIFGCSVPQIDKTKLKSEIEQAEADFNKIVAEQGLAEAFTFFADSSAVIKRKNDSLIFGKAGINNFYSSSRSKTKTTLEWKPDFIDVSESGELGYTYGKYTFAVYDSLGNKTDHHGIFHTVWKKQKDGSWKYVWD